MIEAATLTEPPRECASCGSPGVAALRVGYTVGTAQTVSSTVLCLGCARASVEALSAVLRALDAPVDRRPHSRACGWRAHRHGPECAVDCPTCAQDRQTDSGRL